MAVPTVPPAYSPKSDVETQVVLHGRAMLAPTFSIGSFSICASRLFVSELRNFIEFQSKWVETVKKLCYNVG